MLIHYYYEFPYVWGRALARDAPGDELLGPTEYLGCAGAWGVTDTDWDDYRGVFTDRSMIRLLPLECRISYGTPNPIISFGPWLPKAD